MNDLAILSVGADVDIANPIGWGEEYNVKDYNIVFLNLFSLDENNQQIRSVLSEGYEEAKLPHPDVVTKSLKNGNRIFVFLPSSENIKVGKNRYRKFSSSFPIEFRIESESGSSVEGESIHRKCS